MLTTWFELATDALRLCPELSTGGHSPPSMTIAAALPDD